MNQLLTKENRDNLIVMWAIVEVITLLAYVGVRDATGWACSMFGFFFALICLVLYIAMGRYRG